MGMIVKKNEMNNIKAIPTGYKQTEAGIIPEDWDVFLLGDVFDFKNGLNKGKEYFGVGTPIINYMDVYISGGVYSSFVQGKVLVTQEEKKNYSARKGDVFFTRTSETVEEIGLSSVLLDEIKDAVFSGFILRGRQKTDVFVHSFMKYCFRAENLRRQIKNTASYTTRALTNGSMLSKVIAPAPNKKEQSAIGKVLSDTDTLITALEQLITKKKAIKTATMQQLLTGRTRLPQFSKYHNGTLKNYKTSELGKIPKDWKINSVGDLFSISAGGDLRVDEFSDIKSELHPHPIYSNAISNFGLYGYCQSYDYIGDYLTITARGGIGHAVARKGSFCAIGRLLVLSPKGTSNVKFFEEYINQYLSFANESTGVPQLTAPQAAKYLVNCPSIEEQTAIATILSDMDAELVTLEKKLAKVRDIKQGMMQQLLTGRIRLPLEQQP
ncbi:restriction endonuclease subunit S [Morganella morganii]|uniref:restriction endonuclease subunit S n=1 Tax=Morganella morganii TaxID=582 RepID=UPI00277BAC9E|nr:restriction endonuclease subunit S [Morganella morganii]MDW7794771.1 restriction endonuclease subunit S [Morganella morganii]HDS3817677.1 restriction endonuclease subunit S [Morganella morganii subsp. morganii]